MPTRSGLRGERTYFATILLLLLVLPIGCLVAEAYIGRQPADFMCLAGKWFVFWGVGARLFVAGLRQTFAPESIATRIFEITDPGTYAIVRELGFGNRAIGMLGLASVVRGAWLIPSALLVAFLVGCLER